MSLADRRRVRKTTWKWFKNSYSKARAQGGSVINSAGYAWFSTRPIKRKRKAPWNLIDPMYAPGISARRAADEARVINTIRGAATPKELHGAR